MKKVFSLVTALVLAASLSVSAFAADITAETQQVIENNIAADTNNDISVSAAEAKDDTVLKSDVKSFKGKFTGLFTDLNKLRAECKTLWASISTTNQSIKSQWKALKESLKEKNKTEAKKALTELKAKLDPLRSQVKALHSGIKALRAQKTTEWVNFRAAVKARDESKAGAALNNIISLKAQIVEKQKTILSLKLQILELIKV